MVNPRLFVFFLLGAGCMLSFSPAKRASAALVDESEAALAEASAAAAPVGEGAANVFVRFVQEGGPADGAVRVELTPYTRPLTMLEARSVAEQAFLDALTEPGLGDSIRQVRVVVRLAPAGTEGIGARQETFLFFHKGGQEWSVSAGD